MTKAERDFLLALANYYARRPEVNWELDETARALLAEEEKSKGGDPPTHANHTDQSGNELGGAVARAASTAPAPPVAEPKRGVQEILRQIVDKESWQPAHVRELGREALRLYVEERAARQGVLESRFAAAIEYDLTCEKCGEPVGTIRTDFPKTDSEAELSALKGRVNRAKQRCLLVESGSQCFSLAQELFRILEGGDE